MRKLRLLAFALLICSTTAGLKAAVIADITDQITSVDSTMTGRFFRDGIPSVWGDSKVFPGTTATASSFFYKSYTIDVGYRNYIQVSVDDPFAGVFVAAYMDSFVPAPGPTATNYVGDAGSSGNPFGNTGFFQVTLPKGKDLVLAVVNVPALTGDVGVPYNLLVEGFSDASYGEIPEPATMTLTAGALGILALAARRRPGRA